MATVSDYLKLHFIVFLWGFTAILGLLISIPAVEMVFFRTLLAAIGMATLIYFTKGVFKLPTSDFLKIVFTGFIVAAHWILFFYSARVANASVSLVGFATGSFWTALIEPLAGKQKVNLIEIGLGILVVAGLYIIFSFDFQYQLGLTFGILSGLTVAIFAVINSNLVKRISPLTITLYEMVGATIATGFFLPFYQIFTSADDQLHIYPSGMDWFYLSILALVCSVYAYTAAIELMRRVSAFAVQLTLTMEPVYGIIMAVIVFGEREKMNGNFYIGAAVIISAVLLYPFLKNSSRPFRDTPTKM